MRIRAILLDLVSMPALVALALSSPIADAKPQATVTPPVLTVANLHDKSIVHTGFVVGTANASSGPVTVEVALDGGDFVAAKGTKHWKFKLPSGLATWKENSAHQIVVRATDSSGNTTAQVLNVRKGNNEDVNGDGFPDLLVGDPNFGGNRGRVYLFYSDGAGGIPTDPIIDENNSTPGQHVIGGAFGEGDQLFGTSVALADVNGDGYADLIVGAPASFDGAGRIYVFYPFASNDPDGVTLTGNAAGTSTQLSGDEDHVGFGTAVAAGDITGDGLADVVASAIGNDTQDGRVYIFHAHRRSGILQPTVFTADAVITPETSGTHFGQSIAVGDVNGDGFADVLVGANLFGAADHKGKMYVFLALANGSGIPTPGVDENGVPAMAAVAADTQITGEISSELGTSVAIGDVNGDGFLDVIGGGPAFGGLRGRVYMFYSAGAAGVPTNPFIDENDNTPGQHVIGGLFDGTPNLYGTSVAVADVDGDGLDDLIVGAPAAHTGNGVVYVHFQIAHGDGTSSISDGNAVNSNLRFNGDATHPAFGKSVAALDVNGDGTADVIGAAVIPGGPITGTVYVFDSTLGKRDNASVNNIGAFLSDASTTITGELGGSFGSCIAQ
jgi:hypothetical protein